MNELVITAIDTVAPHVQVPSHLMPLGAGQTRSVNYDHPILGWRAAMRIKEQFGEQTGLLPMTQAMWYVPQGLNPWDQIHCEFPGHYALSNKCDSKDGIDIGSNSFDGPAWSPPNVYFPDQEPADLGTKPGTGHFSDLFEAFKAGERSEAYRLFLGIAQDPAQREALKEATLFSAIIDLQDTLNDRPAYQNIGHKALRTRAMLDLADDLGWDAAHPIFYTVVPDIGTQPLLHALWAQTSFMVDIQFRNTWRQMKQENKAGLTPTEEEETIDAILWGAPYEVSNQISKLLRNGKALLAISDTIVVAYCRYMADMVDSPYAMLIPGHAVDYCNVVNHWMRTYDNPHQVKVVYMQASFVNDVIRNNLRFPRDPNVVLHPEQHRDWASKLSPKELLPEIGKAITEQDANKTMAAVDAYLLATAERGSLIATITFATNKFDSDPHLQRMCMTTFEEYAASRSPQRDQIIRMAAKYASRAIKRALDFEGYNLYQARFGSTANGS